MDGLQGAPAEADVGFPGESVLNSGGSIDMSTIASTTIEVDDRGAAWIIRSNRKVIEIAFDQIAHGWSSDEIYFQHYYELSLAQIHAALSYYYDHQPEFDAEIRRQLAEVRELRAKAGDPLAASDCVGWVASRERYSIHGRACPLRDHHRVFSPRFAKDSR